MTTPTYESLQSEFLEGTISAVDLWTLWREAHRRADRLWFFACKGQVEAWRMPLGERVLSISVPGDPVGKERPRVVHGGDAPRRSTRFKAEDFLKRGKPRTKVKARKVHTYTPGKTDAFEEAVSILAGMQVREPHAGPLLLRVIAVKRRPKKMSKRAGSGRIWRMTTPDLDNIVKAVADGLQRGRAYHDDKVVSAIQAWGCYRRPEEAPCTEAELYKISGLPDRGLPGVERSDLVWDVHRDP